MHPLAQEMNAQLQADASAIYDCLSETGKELYFPSKGILAQSAEAKEKANKFNATIGTATDGKDPLVLDSIKNHFQNLTSGDIFNYAPSFGLAPLREAWKNRLVDVNPSLKGKNYSLPIVTSGITHGLSVASDLFVGEKEWLIIPDQQWEYRLIFETRRKAEIKIFPFFEGKGFNLKGLEALLRLAAKTEKKVSILLNFPNNPTGYSITKPEAEALKNILFQAAEFGLFINVILDDAYTGLFFEAEVEPESLFPKLCDLHPNLLAIKLDGVTKEYFAWGLRVGFVTFGYKNFIPSIGKILENKAAGAVRASISNVTASGQAIMVKALASPKLAQEAKVNFEILKKRALKTKAILAANDFSSVFEAYPFNAGYFMLIRLKNLEAEKLRLHLLNQHGVGTIATAQQDLRIAFSCVPEEHLEELFKIIFQAGKEIA